MPRLIHVFGQRLPCTSDMRAKRLLSQFVAVASVARARSHNQITPVTATASAAATSTRRGLRGDHIATAQAANRPTAPGIGTKNRKKLMKSG